MLTADQLDHFDRQGFDQLVGAGKWLPCRSMGTFPVRFPSAQDAEDTGTVYLCHPFLVHAAQIHRGSQPRFMAQPPLLPVDQPGSTTSYPRSLNPAR
jgi:hypothetical protein